MKLYFKILTICFSIVILAACGSGGSDEPEPVDTPFLKAIPGKIDVKSEGDVLYATVTSNQTVSILTSKTWCDAELVPDAKTDNLKITIGANTGDARSASILLSAEGCPNVEIVILQKAKATDPGGGGDDGETLEFRVASYNVRYAAKEDETQGDGWNVRKGALTNIIKDYKFDIVGTQEANQSQWDDMKLLLPDYGSVGHPYGGSSGTGHNCITFYKKGLFEPLDKGVFWFSETPDEPSIGWDATDRRICYWTKFRDLTTRKEFYFFNAHFYWQFTTAKENSGPLMYEKVKQIAGDNVVIATGDYNSQSTSSQIIKIKSLLSDAYDMSETAREGPVGTSLSGGVFQGTPGSRIDYIFLSKGVRVLDYKVINDTYGSLGHYPSDHLPVTSKISIKLK